MPMAYAWSTQRLRFLRCRGLRLGLHRRPLVGARCLDYSMTMAVATGYVLGMRIHIYNGPVVLDKSKAAVLTSIENSNRGFS